MKVIILLLGAVFVAAFASVGCKQSTQPNTNPEITAHSTLPMPFSNATYFRYGADLSSGGLPILDSLESAGIHLQDAWIPDSFAACMGAILRSQMVVRLTYPDSSIYEFGFTSDSTQLSEYCIVTWKHYHF